MFIFVEYQPFITLKHHQNHAENIMDFEHPTLQGVNAMAIRNPRVSLRLPWARRLLGFQPAPT